ncbi:YciI family protein [Actinoplanes sp. DH11]|uniref:YciI family protein n=1 Tax=Actinoplanes sp. DH11 TaxID=2857011 RepID=UPI001E3BB71F|nr:YciI family protein [Actinoplanes sp. DH11]
MRILAFVCADDSLTMTAEENTIEQWLASTPQRVEGHQLRGREDATTVRDHGALITDGPFADTKEWIAGYDILDCASLEEAVAIAAGHPLARFGAIELRPFDE